MLNLCVTETTVWAEVQTVGFTFRSGPGVQNSSAGNTTVEAPRRVDHVSVMATVLRLRRNRFRNDLSVCVQSFLYLYFRSCSPPQSFLISWRACVRSWSFSSHRFHGEKGYRRNLSPL